MKGRHCFSTSPPMELPDLSKATVFPLLESNSLEFKESLSPSIHLKIRETICAFLNASGGHIVIGVRDVDRYILGVDLNKTVDTLKLRIDDIYRQEIITSEEKLPVGTIVISIVPTAETHVIAIRVTPEVGKSYRMKDGTRWYRLNASNYRLTADKPTFTEEEIEERIKTAVRRAKQARETEIQALKKKLKEIENDFMAVTRAAKYIDMKAAKTVRDFEQVRDMLFDKILEKKDEVEQRSWRCW